jgi:hypothetical protein
MAFNLKLACLALMVPGLMMADISSTFCTSADLCTYIITGTGLGSDTIPPTELTSSTWTLTFSTLGPEMFNAPANFLQSFSVTGTPGGTSWSYDAAESGLTSYGSDGAALVTFDYESGSDERLNSVTYEFFGTDAFWATTGANIAFGATDDSSQTSGAFFNFSIGQSDVDPPCTECTVSISASTAPVPEPGAVALLATVVGIFLFVRRRQQKFAAPAL